MNEIAAVDAAADQVPEVNKIYVASNIKFSSLAGLFEKISKIGEVKGGRGPNGLGKNEEKKRLLQNYHKYWRDVSNDLNGKLAAEAESSPKKSNVATVVDSNYFSVMRLLLPGDDRRIYGLKESKLAISLISALSISKNTDDGLKLINYRAPANVKSDGDFASVAFFVLKSRCQENITLSLHEINQNLDIIAINNAKGREGQREVNKSIQHLLVSLSALELKWLIRIILKDLKIGIKESTILDSYHADAMDLYNCSSSLEKVCELLHDPNKRLHEVAISLFAPCRPMLGDKAEPNQIEKLSQTFYIETKFDGERFQLHKSGNMYAYFSRNSKDYSDNFGTDATSGMGTLTPFIHSAFLSSVKNCILDGEMCGFNNKENVLLSKTEQYDVKSNVRTHTDLQTCFVVFDVLYLNDVVLTNKPLKERIDFLKKTFNEIDGRIMHSQRETACTKQQIAEALNKAIDSRLEGILVKDPESVYKPSVRSNSGWFKVKPDYMLGLNDDMDLLIVGGYYGSGRRSGLLSHFLLAVSCTDEKTAVIQKPKHLGNVKSLSVCDDLDLEGNDQEAKIIKAVDVALDFPKLFYTFCKIGSGYTMKELYDFNQKLANKWIKFDKSKPPGHLQFTVEKPDVWIEPKDSFIVQVKAVEIVDSTKYKTGCSLRFPRLEKFRSDKHWYECMKLSELKELRNKNEGMLASGKHLNLNENEEKGDESGEPTTKRTKKTTTKTSHKAAVGNIYRGIDASCVDKIDEMFSDKEFCVIVEDNHEMKLRLEKSVVEFGGELTQNPSENTFCIVTNKKTHKINSYIRKDFYDVVRADWLQNCISGKRIFAWKPNDMIYSKQETRELFKKSYDDYGDSYFEDLTNESIKTLFENLDSKFYEKQSIDALREKIAVVENKYFPDESYRFGLFRLCTVYLDRYERVGTGGEKLKNTSFDLIEFKVRWRGGKVVDKIDEGTSHCVVEKSDTSRLSEIKKLNRERNSKPFHLVSSEWLEACIKANRMVNELSYHL